MENILSVKQIKKSFGGVHALKGVDLTIRKGETHCLAGENGCGKSTIIKVISGFYKMDAGTIEVDGKNYPVMTPQEAIKAGIQVIYQDFSIFPNLTVIENLAFNQVLANKKKFVNRKEFRRIAEEAVAKINFDVDLDALVETLPVADKQLIAISRALLDNAKLIIMDEPTTALTKKEVRRLFEIIAQLKANGVTILFVSHKLDEVFEISDSITIMRNGENVISCPTSEMTEEKFTYYMTGRTFEDKHEGQERTVGKPVLEVSKLSAPGFKDVSFTLHAGEILGVTGQLGSGRTELSLALSGMLSPTAGTIALEGKPVRFSSASKAQKAGVSLVPEDRLTEGLFLPQSIVDNITVTQLDTLGTAVGYVDRSKVLEESAKWVRDIGVATKDHTFPVSTLSGGNQQKVVLARALATHPKVLILNGPTVGVDIGAKYDIHNLLKQLASEGVAIIVVSDDTAEVIATCDRALIMQNGRITGELSRENLTAQNLADAAG
ncbi:MAG: sugar ABC transporter ATP-binding protein [Clostridia bacterium]|nr:sugar ABC transporter ATP-binding protein [Clostridia bacterium]